MTTKPDFLRRGPVPLAPDNFTPLARTPWAGEAIARDYKAHLLPAKALPRVGESWEFSAGPEFPSALADGSTTLDELMRLYPDDVYSSTWTACQPPECTLLVKLLDASDPLSLQVHPRDDDPALKPGECGKPESWLILDAEPGAGIYLGFSRSMTRSELRRALETGGDVGSLLHFEPARPGDYFEIGPGVAHAIGAGVTLLEPQRVLAGKSGKTYRLYDWDRRYDAKGLPDSVAGKPRELHLDQGLALVDPEHHVGPAFAQSLRRTPAVRSLASGARIASFPSNGYYQLHHVTLPPDSSISVSLANGYGALVMLAGDATFGHTDIRLQKGQTALLPHAASPVRARAGAASAFAVVVPHGAAIEIETT